MKREIPPKKHSIRALRKFQLLYIIDYLNHGVLQNIGIIMDKFNITRSQESYLFNVTYDLYNYECAFPGPLFLFVNFHIKNIIPHREKLISIFKALLPYVGQLTEHNIHGLWPSYDKQGYIGFLRGNPPESGFRLSREFFTDQYHSRVGKFLNKYTTMSPVITQQVAEAWLELYHVETGVKEIKVISSLDDICYAYLGKNYSTFHPHGELHSSCMRSHEFQDTISHYARINVKMLVAYDGEGNILARALLWENVRKDGQEVTYLDRIYAVGNKYIFEKMVTYASEQGWEIRGWNSGRMCYEAAEPIQGECPYFDTFCYYDVELGEYTNLQPEGEHYVLQETDGTYTDSTEEDIVELADGRRVNEDEAVWVEMYQEYYHLEDTVFAHNGNYILYEESVEIGGYYYHREDDEITMDEVAGNYIYTDDSVELEDGRVTHVDNVIIFDDDGVGLRSEAYYDPDGNAYRSETEYLQCTLAFEEKETASNEV